MVKIRLLLTQEQVDHLMWEARKRQTSISEVVREILEVGKDAAKMEEQDGKLNSNTGNQ